MFIICIYSTYMSVCRAVRSHFFRSRDLSTSFCFLPALFGLQTWKVTPSCSPSTQESSRLLCLDRSVLRTTLQRRIVSSCFCAELCSRGTLLCLDCVLATFAFSGASIFSFIVILQSSPLSSSYFVRCFVCRHLI